MKFITIKTETTFLNIELNPTAFVNKWIHYMNSLNSISYTIEYRDHRGGEDPLGYEYSINLLESALIDCSASYYDFSKSLNALNLFKQEQKQEYLNIIHRDFTHSIIYGHITIKDTFLYKRTHDINEAVHRLEGYTFLNCNRRKKFGDIDYYLYFTNANNMDKDFSPFTKAKAKIPNWIFNHRTEDTNFNVWLNEDILGKDLIRCFLDDDDPNNIDITGNQFLTPNIIIDVNNMYHTILQSKSFNKWYKRFCSGKKLNRWPLGKINLKKYNMPKTFSEKVLNMKFAEDYINV